MKNIAKLIRDAKVKGAEVGVFFAGKPDASVSIYRASIGYTNNLPINNIAFEDKLRAAFQAAGQEAIFKCSQ
jgi:hypothetical protein